MPTATHLEPYEPTSLFELISRQTLGHLITGFREKLRTGVALYCHDEEGNLTRVEPDEADEAEEGERHRHWSTLCRIFREDAVGEAACQEFDESIASEFLKPNSPAGRCHKCRPLGVTDMAAQIRVYGRPLGVVLAGQRLPSDLGGRRQLEARVRKEYANRKGKLLHAICQDYSKKGPFTSVCGLEETGKLLDDVQDFARLIAAICESVAARQERVRQRDFIASWIHVLSDTQPNNLIAWQRSLQKCLNSFLDFIGRPVERIGLFHGKTCAAGSSTVYSLTAMNSTWWWNSRPIELAPDSPVLQNRPFTPGELPGDIAPGVGDDVAAKKHFWFFPFRHAAPEEGQELQSLVALQSSRALHESTLEFARDFCDGLCRRDAISRLFLQRLTAYRDLERQVVDLRHDLRTSVQHVVAFAQKMIRRLRKSSGNGDKQEVEGLIALMRRSVGDHVTRVDQLRPPKGRYATAELESVDVFDILRKQISLYSATAEEKRKGIKIRSLSDGKASVVCERSELDRAIAALLDNAIKYSYDGRIVYLDGSITDGTVTFAIENYGIGIPPDKLAKIRRRDVRAEVRDQRRRRIGTGLGLPIAVYVFEELLGGQLTIESHHAKKVTGPHPEYHRHITTVTVLIPLGTKELH